MPCDGAIEARHARAVRDHAAAARQRRGACGPGVGDHASPVSSSRMKIASPVGSVTGSLANGVSRFSRLFSDQVNAAPDARHDRAERRVGDDVDPRQRRLLVAVEDDHVLAAVRR